jgi:stalled ribosome alternative rescue factor ArfA
MASKVQTITGKAPKSRRSAEAASLSQGQFQPRKERPKKGRGSYSRNRLDQISSPANL